jgi:predicted RND superfamily exporter protein
VNQSIYARYGWVILFLMAGITGILVDGAWRAMQTQSNRGEDWLPADYQETKDLNWFYEHFPGDDLLMISWEGCTFEDPRIKSLVELLRQPVDLDGERGLQVFRDVVTAQEVSQQLQNKYPEIGPRRALSQLEGWLVGPEREEGERTSCIIVHITPIGWEHRFSMIDHIYRCADQVPGLSADAIHMAGPTIDGVAIDRASADSIKSLLWLCMLTSVAITLFCFRSVRLMLLVMISEEVNRCLTLALVYYSGAAMDSILLVAPSLVGVLTVSTAVHLVNYYGDAVVESGIEGASVRAVRLGWLPCLLATITTVLGLLSLLVSSLLPIRKFSAFATLGLCVGIALLFLALPALLEKSPPRRWILRLQASRESRLEPWIWNALHRQISSHYLVIILGAFCLMMASGWGLTKLRSTASVHDMLPSNNRVIQDYRWLEDHVGPLAPLEIILQVSKPPLASGNGEFIGYPMLERMQLVIRAEAAVRRVAGVDRTVSAASFTPSLTPSRARVARLAILNRRLTSHRADFIASGFLRETPDADLWRISARVRASDQPDYIGIYEGLKREFSEYVKSDDPAIASVEAVVFTGAIPIMQKSQQQVLQDLFRSFVTAFLFIAAAMIILLRNISGGLISMIPNVFPPVLVFGILGWLGVAVEVGSMMTATVAMAIAVDDTLHYLTWFRRGIAQGKSRGEAVEFAYTRCGAAMFQTTLICGLGLFVFVLSPFVPISRFAMLMFSMLSVALLGDLIVLPALLLSPLGRVFMPRGRAPDEVISRCQENDLREDSTSATG